MTKVVHNVYTIIVIVAQSDYITRFKSQGVPDAEISFSPGFLLLGCFQGSVTVLQTLWGRRWRVHRQSVSRVSTCCGMVWLCAYCWRPSLVQAPMLLRS